MALITAAQAKDRIPGLNGTGEDALLERLIAVAGAAIATFLGYPPASVGASPTAESTSYTIDCDSYGGRDLPLPVWPATAVSSVRDDETLDFDQSIYLVPSSDYALTVDGRAIRLKFASTWGNWRVGRGTIRVVFTAGYTTIPVWLQDACKIMVRHLYDLRQVQGRQNQSIAGVNVAIGPGYNDTLRNAGAMPQECIDLLAPHRHPSVLC